MKIQEKEVRSRRILEGLYREGYIESIFTTKNPRFFEGWTLKNGMWSCWYFNLRPVGASPELVADIAESMNLMTQDNVPGLTQILGIEMAGVPLVSAIGTAGRFKDPRCRFIPYSYTRALPGGSKPRNPQELEERLTKMEIQFGYGGKELVEGKFRESEVICIVDDMVTDFGSKLMAKMMLGYELKGRGVEKYSANHVAVVLDREQGAAEEAMKHNMHLHPLIRFKTDGLGWLKNVMHPEEHELITGYQSDPKQYQGQDNLLRLRAIEAANKYREKK